MDRDEKRKLVRYAHAKGLWLGLRIGFVLGAVLGLGVGYMLTA